MPLHALPNPYAYAIIPSVVTVLVGGYIAWLQSRTVKKLERELAAFSHRHSIYCQKQAEVFGELYNRLYDWRTTLRYLANQSNVSEHNSYLLEEAKVEKNALDYYGGNRFYFKGDDEQAVNNVLTALDDLPRLYYLSQTQPRVGPEAAEHNKTLREQHKLADNALMECREQFHKILSAS